MGKNQFLNKHQFLGISKEELERKWRVQEIMEREKYMPSVYWPLTPGGSGDSGGSGGSSEISYPTDTINDTHIGRLFYLDENGKGVLTQKTGGSEGQLSVLKWTADDADSFDLPIHPVFLLTINTNFADGESIQLPHPNSSINIAFVAKDTPVNPEDFQIGASIEDSRDNLQALIQSLWNISGKNQISATSSGLDGISIEILATSNEYQDVLEFFMPTDFNGIENDILTDADVDYILTQSGVNGCLENAFLLSGTYQVKVDFSCHLVHDSNPVIKIFPASIIHKDVSAGVLSWGFMIPQSGEDIITNVRDVLSGVIGGDANISPYFDISTVLTDGSTKYVTATQTDLNVFTQTLGVSNELITPSVEVLQQVVPSSPSYVLSQIIGFVSFVKNGRVYVSTSYLNFGVLSDGSNSMPAPEMGDYSHFKMVLLPSNEGKLENAINWGASLENPSPDVASALFLNGGYIALENRESGFVLVKPIHNN